MPLSYWKPAACLLGLGAGAVFVWADGRTLAGHPVCAAPLPGDDPQACADPVPELPKAPAPKPATPPAKPSLPAAPKPPMGLTTQNLDVPLTNGNSFPSGIPPLPGKEAVPASLTPRPAVGAVKPTPLPLFSYPPPAPMAVPPPKLPVAAPPRLPPIPPTPAIVPIAAVMPAPVTSPAPPPTPTLASPAPAVERHPSPKLPTVASNWRALVHLGNGPPHFEIQEGEEAILKVTCERIEIQTPPNGRTLSVGDLRAIGQVHVSGPGFDATCGQLVFVPGKSIVMMNGDVHVYSHKGRAGSEMMASQVIYQPGSGPTSVTPVRNVSDNIQ